VTEKAVSSAYDSVGTLTTIVQSTLSTDDAIVPLAVVMAPLLAIVPSPWINAPPNGHVANAARCYGVCRTSLPAKRTTGLEPATFGLGSRRSTN
jgi:hypothetical protein